MEAVKVLVDKCKADSSAVSILISPKGVNVARISTAPSTSNAWGINIETVSTLESSVRPELLANCTRAAVFGARSLSGDSTSDLLLERALLNTLTEWNVAVCHLDAGTQQLKGLAYHWYSASAGAPSQHWSLMWHEPTPPCDQLVTHSPSWRLINDRLARRMLRNGPPEDLSGPLIVAQLGPRDLSLHKIDSSLRATELAREPFLGYKNLLGLARLSAFPIGEGASTLEGLLDLAAKGNLAKLDLTIGDLLPPESLYGHYDVNTIVFSLGKLHDLKSLAELQPSQNDVAASLTYAFIKTFFDAVVHATSAHGIPRVVVLGEFFQPESCRRRLMEAWNFTGVPKDALSLHFLRPDCADLLALTGGLVHDGHVEGN